jgi:hypothetical protein
VSLDSDPSLTPGCRQKSRSRRASSTTMTETEADCLRLLPDRRLGSFHRLRDLHHGCQSSRQRTRTFQRKQSGTRVFMRCDAARGAETAWRSSRDGAPVLTCAEFSDDAPDGQMSLYLEAAVNGVGPGYWRRQRWTMDWVSFVPRPKHSAGNGRAMTSVTAAIPRSASFQSATSAGAVVSVASA